jgi:hypothetical protein
MGGEGHGLILEYQKSAEALTPHHDGVVVCTEIVFLSVGVSAPTLWFV